MSSFNTTASQTSHNLAADDHEVSHAVTVEIEKDPLGLVEEISQQLEQTDPSLSHQTGQRDSEAITAEDRVQDSTDASQSPAQEQEQDHRETDVVAEETITSNCSIVITNVNALEMTKL